MRAGIVAMAFAIDVLVSVSWESSFSNGVIGLWHDFDIVWVAVLHYYGISYASCRGRAGNLMLLLVWISFGYFDEERHAAVTIGGVYWHFVDVVWLFVFPLCTYFLIFRFTM